MFYIKCLILNVLRETGWMKSEVTHLLTAGWRAPCLRVPEEDEPCPGRASLLEAGRSVPHQHEPRSVLITWPKNKVWRLITYIYIINYSDSNYDTSRGKQITTTCFYKCLTVNGRGKLSHSNWRGGNFRFQSKSTVCVKKNNNTLNEYVKCCRTCTSIDSISEAAHIDENVSIKWQQSNRVSLFQFDTVWITWRRKSIQ